MNEGNQDKAITISREEQEARLLSSVILEYNDESQYLARDDRKDLITFGDGQGNKFPIPFSEGEKVLWKQIRRFRNLVVHGFTRFVEDGSIVIRPSEKWKTPRYDADIQPFPNSLGQQVDGVYKYSLSEMRGLAGLFRGMSPLNRLRMSLDTYHLCPSCGSHSPSIIGLERGSILEFPCGFQTLYQQEGGILSKCKVKASDDLPATD